MDMQLYAIRRRNVSSGPNEMEQAGNRSSEVGEEMKDRIRWIRSYVVKEENGGLGTICIYQAADEEAIREHASRAAIPADEVNPVVDTLVMRDDPKPASEAAS
ncbi:nickel-binding protein [Thiohalomonas denitrificans]|uniref:DUF4242 domain-containing protein n=1 Tax=Thiohalomonas denitrificans TaxID=415747 RepID=A0A1G5QVL2_9GAMM|nr:nickel-binding protein [Thiohalomonas denitrificans]SCZ65706.1 Protein of unknown function [Thiohalomonas denitrificans]